MIDTNDRTQIIERELSPDHSERRDYAVERATETARQADPETRAFLARRYSGYAELLRLRANRQEAEAAFRSAHAAWHDLDVTLRGAGQDHRMRALEAGGVSVLAPWVFDGSDSPSELRQAAEMYAGLAAAAN